jgi:uncharacterized protein
MNFYFFDSSATVKNYVQETGSNWVKNIFNTISTDVIYASVLTQVEVVAAIARRRKGKSLSITDANNLIQQFNIDFTTDFRSVSVNLQLIAHAVNLADKHSLRGYDAVQLAAVLEVYARLVALSVDFNLTPLTFVSADNELNAAATSEGLNVANPNNYP